MAKAVAKKGKSPEFKSLDHTSTHHGLPSRHMPATLLGHTPAWLYDTSSQG
jgi:hypothetical protein